MFSRGNYAAPIENMQLEKISFTGHVLEHDERNSILVAGWEEISVAG